MKKNFSDQLGRTIAISYPPKRIISLVPSQTELLFDLGLDAEIIGLTKFCVHPQEKIKSKVRIGGTKKLNLQRIIDLNPDLIIGNKEENSRADIEALMELFPVWMSDIKTLDDAQAAISDIGALVDREPEAAYLNHLIASGFADLKQLAVQNQVDARLAYLIWKDPFMFAGHDTFINDMLQLIGFRNVVLENRYPEMDLQLLANLKPDLVFLSSEPYPFKEKHVNDIAELLPGVKVMLVDGEMFSWYGSRLVKAIEYFFHLQKAFYRNS